jgi:ABC-type nickel/cobalt efflux system permease component RcnA
MLFTLLLVLGSGLLAGAVHVVTGADHLAALLPLSIGRRRGAWALGARWGVGHSLGVLVIGALAVALKERLDLGLVEAWGERLVGVLLIAIGLLGMRRALRLTLHAHPHDHDGEGHAHLHLHTGAERVHGPESHAGTVPRHGHTAFFAGTLHGVAGTAHLLGVLPALALPGLLASGAYLLAFAAGTVAAMAAFAGFVGESSARMARGPALLRPLLCAASVVTVVVGAAWLVLSTVGSSAPAAG